MAGTVAAGRAPRPGRSAVLPAAVGAAAAMLALSTLGLTWLSRTVQGPLGDAGASEVEQLSGREVAPLVAALVPGVTAVVVVALLLRGWWRVGALACLVVTVCAVLAAVGAVRDARRPATRAAPASTPNSSAPVPPAPVPPTPPEPTPSDLWHELDEGRDPTGPA